MKRNNFLDVLKGFCILVVILTHFDWVDAQRLKLFFPFWLNAAVPIFMIISGYVYTESYKRKNANTLKQVYNPSGITDKIIRYTLPFAIIFVIELVLKTTVYHKRYQIGEVLYQFIIGGWGPGSYYYPYMIQFVFVFPIIYLIIQKWDFKGLVGCALLNILYEVIKVELNMPKPDYRLIVLRYIFAMAIGCYFSIGKFKIRKWMGITSFVLGAAYIYAISYGEYDSRVFNYWIRTSMPTLLYVAPVAYLLIKKCTWECKPMAYLGKASYSIYLAQMIYFHFADHIFDGVDVKWSAMLTTYIICITSGLLFNLLVQYIMPKKKKPAK